MSLNVKDPEAHRLARAIAEEATGETMTYLRRLTFCTQLEHASTIRSGGRSASAHRADGHAESVTFQFTSNTKPGRPALASYQLEQPY